MGKLFYIYIYIYIFIFHNRFHFLVSSVKFPRRKENDFILAHIRFMLYVRYRQSYTDNFP